MKYNKSILAILFLTILSLGCKKKKADPSPTLSTLEYLAGSSNGTGVKKWKVTEGTVKQNDLTINLIANQPPCITDNIITLYSNKTYELTEGATKCNAATDPDLILKATWDYDETSKILAVDRFLFLQYAIDKPKFLISEVNAETFKGKADVDLNGRKLVVNVTFSALK